MKAPRRLPEVVELATFVAAADERSIRRAAATLHLSPAAVTKRLNNLEAVVGVRLLERDPRGLRLTREGVAFYPRAVRLVEDAAALVAVLPEPVGLPGVQQLLGSQSRQPVEAVLRDTESVLAGVLHLASDGVAIASLGERRVVETNEAFRSILGEGELALAPSFWDALAHLGEAHALVGALEVAGRRVARSGDDVAVIRVRQTRSAAA